MRDFVKKFILSLLTLATVMTPVAALAQVPGAKVPVTVEGKSFLPGGGIGSAVGTACLTASVISGQVQSVLSQGLNLLGESSSLVTSLEAEKAKVNAAIECWTNVIRNPTTRLFQDNLFDWARPNADKEQALGQIAALEQIRKQLEARIQVASQNFWKAVLIGLLLKQTDRITERLVNQLTQKFKINNYAKYISALADTVYVNDAILHNVDNDKDRAIVRSIITNPLLRNKIHPVIAASANTYVGFEPNMNNLPFNDPAVMNRVVRLNNRQEYIENYQSKVLAKVDLSIAQAREAALTDINQGQGYKSTINNCGPSISAQRRKDLEYQAVLREIEDRLPLYNRINASPTATVDEKQKIKTDLDNAQNKLSTFGQMALQICEGVNTPATKFKDSIHDLINGQIKNFTEYNDNNLPLFQRLVVSLADNLISRFVFGDNARSGDLIGEATGAALTGVINGIPTYSSSDNGGSGGGSPTGNVIINARGRAVNGQVPPPTTDLVRGEPYLIRVDFSGIAAQQPYKAFVSGPVWAIGQNREVPLTPEYLNAKYFDYAILPASNTFIFTVTFFARPTTSQGEDVSLGSFDRIFNVSNVQGASTTNLMPRGPMILTRGY